MCDPYVDPMIAFFLGVILTSAGVLVSMLAIGFFRGK